jgi:TonB family protein
MKQLVKYFSLLLVTGIVISCNSSSDYSTTSSSDSNTVAKDNTSNPAMDSTLPPKTDTSLAAAPGSKDSIPMKAKVVKGKNGKTGKIAVVFPKMESNPSAKMDVDNEGAYTNVEVTPAYPGGQRALENFFNYNVAYPQQAADNGTEGVINVSFIVDENGKVSSPKILGKRVGDGLEDEALRVVNRMPSWTPGKVKGKNVKTRLTLPVRFQLES